MRPANPGRKHEAECTIDGQHFLLVGSLGNIARFRERMKVVGLTPLLSLISIADPFALIEGVKIFAAEPFDERKLDECSPDAIDAIQRAMCKALTGNWPGEGEAADDGAKKKPKTVIPADMKRKSSRRRSS